jgi:hypothetical protein
LEYSNIVKKKILEVKKQIFFLNFLPWFLLKKKSVQTKIPAPAHP